MKEYSEVVIIGAGAAGLLCGGLLAKEGIQVTMIDKNKCSGRKLLATGNGRCNFTNLLMRADCYYGNQRWIESVLNRVTPKAIMDQFEQIGVLPRVKDGYVYPYTNQAVTVVDHLNSFCKMNQADILLECKVSGIRSLGGDHGYAVRTREGDIRCQYILLATGGKASEELGGDGSGYKLARSLGHQIHTIYPGLTGLKCQGDWWKKVAGTRIQGRFSIMVDGRFRQGECGEIQIVKDGVSGIPVFQMCRIVAEALSNGQRVEGILDFVPPLEHTELSQWLADHGLDGLVPKKWLPILKNRSELAACLKSFRFSITATFGMERAQVTAGGIPTNEVNPDTLESNVASGIYLAGELLDVDGKCGGYNLHFAWAGATIVADSLIKQIKGNK